MFLLRLYERDRDEALRISARTFTFPDGVVREIETYRMVWTWYDRLLAAPGNLSRDGLLRDAQRHAAEKDLPLADAFACVVEAYVARWEGMGVHLTDPEFDATVAKIAVVKHVKKRLREGREA